jgi:hypothetical protein
MICPTETYVLLVCFFPCYSLFCFCRSAFVGIIGKGGLRSLYAGWGAVLCRNVPHSIIKVRSSYMLDGSITKKRDCHGKKPHTHTQLALSYVCMYVCHNELERDQAISYKCYSKLPVFILWDTFLCT